MNRKSVTVVVVVVLCAAGFAYSQGWFDRSSGGTETQGDTVSANQALDQDNTKADAVPVATRDSGSLSNAATE